MDFREMNQVAKIADCDWRSVRRYFIGGQMKTRTKARVEKAISIFARKKFGTQQKAKAL